MVWIGDASWDAFVEAGRRFGIVPRRPHVIAVARRSRVLLLRHEPSTIDLDVSLGALPFEEEMIARARRHRLGRLSVPLPAPEDLIASPARAADDAAWMFDPSVVVQIDLGPSEQSIAALAADPYTCVPANDAIGDRRAVTTGDGRLMRRLPQRRAGDA